MVSSSLRQIQRFSESFKSLKTSSQWLLFATGLSSVALLGSAMLTLSTSNLNQKQHFEAVSPRLTQPTSEQFNNPYDIQPLAMDGGDPYVRALMRTISASEAYDASPYTIVYGGQHVSDLTNHPEICVTIQGGPNAGNCSTAAGRYQFIDSTWYSVAERYHPEPQPFLDWHLYSFEPKYQDAVLYGWLSDSQAWGFDIPRTLREGRVEEVLRLLSPTWTSLGYGIETNSMSQHLPQIYQDILRQELQQSKNRA